MMIISSSDLQQDTLPVKSFVFQDTFKLEQDSALLNNYLQRKDSIPLKSAKVPKPAQFIFADTTSVCARNSISDVTFYDSTNIFTRIELSYSGKFPFNFIEKNKLMHDESRASLMKQLKSGLDIPPQRFHNDLAIVIILIAALLYSIVRTYSKSFFPVVTRFFFFRGINDPSSRDIGGLFHWQSTILNLISFLIIGLFFYFAADYYEFIPSATRGIIFWLISLGFIISVITLQHLVCVITGSASGEREVFREYLLAVYQSFRFTAFFLFIIITLISYTIIFPYKVYFISGMIVLITMYLIRVIRLLIIFINRKLSIFYLILYLCALEILPVLIAVKYFRGLV